MFTTLLETRRARRRPVAGGALSVALHTAIVAAAIAGGVPHPHRTSERALPAERIEWLAAGASHAPRVSRAPLGRARRQPVAFAVPGARAPERGMSRSATPSRGRRGAVRGLAFYVVRLRLPRVHLTALDDAIGGAVLLNPGVASSAPDFARLASPPGDFERGRLVEAARDVRSPVRPAGSAYSVADVEEPPVALVGNPRPAYPPALARARVDGRVVVQFQIDSTGAVDVHSLRVLESTHALFTDAVRAVVPLLRFLPAHIGHRAVRVFVQQPFAFEMAAGS